MKGADEDRFQLSGFIPGANTACTFSLSWNGDTFGFDEDAIDGLSIGAPPTLVSAADSGDSTVDDTIEAS